MRTAHKIPSGPKSCRKSDSIQWGELKSSDREICYLSAILRTPIRQRESARVLRSMTLLTFCFELANASICKNGI